MLKITLLNVDLREKKFSHGLGFKPRSPALRARALTNSATQTNHYKARILLFE